MTAPDLPAGWYVTDDAYGEPTLWNGATAVWRESDFAAAGAEWRDDLWSVLTRVLAPDEATVERLGRAVAEYDGHDWDTAHPDEQDAYVEHVNVTLTALAGTSAQARHTADDAAGGGEDG